MHDVAKPVKTQVKSKLKTMGVAVGGLIALIIVIVGIKGLQIGKMMSTPNGDAADNGIERNCERRRLGAGTFGSRFDLGRARRGRFQRACRRRQSNSI